MGCTSRSASFRASHQSENRATATKYALRVFRLRMFAVKNSQKRLLASGDCKNIFGTLPAPASTAARFRPEMGMRSPMGVQAAVPELLGIDKVGGVNVRKVFRRLQRALCQCIFLAVFG